MFVFLDDCEATIRFSHGWDVMDIAFGSTRNERVGRHATAVSSFPDAGAAALDDPASVFVFHRQGRASERLSALSSEVAGKSPADGWKSPKTKQPVACFLATGNRFLDFWAFMPFLRRSRGIGINYL